MLKCSDVCSSFDVGAFGQIQGPEYPGILVFFFLAVLVFFFFAVFLYLFSTEKASIFEALKHCVSYGEENTCVSYEEEDTCVPYEEEDICVIL